MQINKLIQMPKGNSGSSQNLTRLSETSNEIVVRYGSALDFAKSFNPDMQVKCAQNIERSFTGTAPTIGALRNAYNDNQVHAWIYAQLENLNMYTGVKNKIQPHQMTMLADIILVEYYYLKASELLLFFYQFKAGKYGELYGSVDPIKVTSALIEFIDYRRDKLAGYERVVREQKRLENEKERALTAISYDEYKMLKRNKRRKAFVKAKNSGIVKLINRRKL